MEGQINGVILFLVELAKKMINKNLYGVTTPLITSSTGQKMGKTAKGAIWLSKDKLKVTDFGNSGEILQMMTFLGFYIFTDLDSKEIENLRNVKKDINELKIILANEVTKLFSEEDSKYAEKEASALLSSSNIDISTIKNSEKKISINEEIIKNGISIKEVLIKLHLSTSNGESKRLIAQGAVKVNDKVILNKEEFIKLECLK